MNHGTCFLESWSPPKLIESHKTCFENQTYSTLDSYVLRNAKALNKKSKNAMLHHDETHVSGKIISERGANGITTVLHMLADEVFRFDRSNEHTMDELTFQGFIFNYIQNHNFLIFIGKVLILLITEDYYKAYSYIETYYPQNT
jgi:hypothetical protein